MPKHRQRQGEKKVAKIEQLMSEAGEKMKHAPGRPRLELKEKMGGLAVTIYSIVVLEGAGGGLERCQERIRIPQFCKQSNPGHSPRCHERSRILLLPLLIYPYKRIAGKHLLDGFPDALLQISDNGWITCDICYAWLRDTFIPGTQHVKSRSYCLRTAMSATPTSTSQICHDNGIILFGLPAHASHLVQPLKAFFASIKSVWSSANIRHIADCGDAVHSVGLDTFARVFQPATS
ncbi:Pogo transposable element with KRAB domain [Elysia marginata]|uniref:Pogo transposable element with KRAB domain n=1 Tax=Elysia marginata TaxID=1093978 RepID=A0AAV4GFJ6_9GAST|nr:Pogo transposable element with KRAB domain [Elysia marginata]